MLGETEYPSIFAMSSPVSPGMLFSHFCENKCLILVDCATMNNVKLLYDQ